MIDFLEHEKILVAKRKRRKLYLVLAGFFVLFVFFSLRAFANLLYTPRTIEEVIDYQEEVSEKPQQGLRGYLHTFFIKPQKTLKGELSDRINILLLGMGGEGHDGPYLADTILLASLKPSTKQIGLLSIPRDLGIAIPEYGVRKINNANAIGEVREKGTGGLFTASLLEKMLDEKIHYVVRVDFKGFEKLIDEVGGVDIYVERSFEDSLFPAENYLYRTVSFTKGWEHMSGARALDFARSRHGNNGESSDFARSYRQQHVLEALKEKLLSFNTVSNPVRLKKIIDVLGNHLTTNLELWEMVRFASLAPHFKESTPLTTVLHNGPNGLLTESTGQDGAYLLLPNDSSFKEIQAVVETLYAPSADLTQANKRTAPKEPIHIAVYNGTWEAGFAAAWKEKLIAQNFDIVEIGNAQEKPYDKTSVFILNERSDTKKKAQELMDVFKTSAPLNVSTRAALFDSTDTSSTPPSLDVIVILGHDQLEQPAQ